MTEAIAYIPFDTFLAAEAQSPIRHDRVTGRVYAMAGGTEYGDIAFDAFYDAIDARASR